MSVFTDGRLIDGQDATAYNDFFPKPLSAAATQAPAESDWKEKVENVGMAAAAVAPGRRPFTVGNRLLDINHVHVSSGHVNERSLRETARQHGNTLTRVLQPCGGCLEAKDVRARVPRRTTSSAGRPMEMVHIDLTGPYEASMGGSICTCRRSSPI